MNLIFTPSQGLTVSNLRAASSTQITAQVQIAATAQSGNRQIVLVDGDHTLRISTPFTITAAPQNNCPPGMLAASGCAPPELRGFTPVQGLQGTTVAMTFTGVNFTAPAAVLFTPNAGLTVQSVAVTNTNQIQAQITIAPNAPIGSRAVVVTVGGQSKLTAPNTFTVMSAAPPVHFMPMQILRVIPNQIAAGSQNVDLTLEGTGFTPGTLVTFTTGAGVPAAIIANGPARYINSTEMHVSVNALPTALPGGRDINLRAPGLPPRATSITVNGIAAQP
ncbi:MAG TPA: IPT/TIG domain-containing protein, partial [Terracidiphilus sp.]|nr:IPT/TIG domain-containing protein [Terracidiphilus sp.]